MTAPAQPSSWFEKTRDRIAWRIATFALNHIATPWYRGMIGGLTLPGSLALVP